MENEKWIGDGWKAGDVDHRTLSEQGEGPTSAEVVTRCFICVTVNYDCMSTYINYIIINMSTV